MSSFQHPWSGYPKTWNGRAVSTLEGDLLSAFLLKLSREHDAPEHLEKAVRAGLPVSGSQQVFVCLFEAIDKDGRNDVLLRLWMQMAEVLIVNGGDMTGSSDQETGFHLLVDIQNRADGFGWSMSHSESRSVVDLIFDHTPAEQYQESLTACNKQGRTPLECAFKRGADPVIPGLLKLYHKAGVTPPWAQVFGWLGAIEEKHAFGGHQELNLDSLLTWLIETGAPVSGMDGQLLPLATFAKPGGDLERHLVARERQHLQTGLAGAADEGATQGPRLRL
jgi:hypothetical protein